MNKKRKVISQCCVCRKIRLKEDFKVGDDYRYMYDWGYYEEEIKKLREKYNVELSHGYCDDCFEEWLQEES